MDHVTWRAHPLHDWYELSDDGRIRSMDRIVELIDGRTRPHRGRVLRTRRNRTGYLVCTIATRDGARTFELHRLMCETFHGLPDPGLETRHLNGNQLDNRSVNLAWGTRSENIRDTIRHGTYRGFGEGLRGGSRKLPPDAPCPAGHARNDRNAGWRRHTTGHIVRYCKECNRIRRRAQRAAKRPLKPAAA